MKLTDITPTDSKGTRDNLGYHKEMEIALFRKVSCSTVLYGNSKEWSQTRCCFNDTGNCTEKAFLRTVSRTESYGMTLYGNTRKW